MKQIGVNMGNVKVTNRSYVLQLLLSKGALSRTDIASSLGLTTATLTTICNDFIAKGLLVQKGEANEPSRVGRKKFLIELNYTFKHVIAVDIHTKDTVISITTLNGTVVDSKILPTNPGNDAEGFIRDIAVHCIQLLWSNHLQDKDILGIGVTVIGPVDHHSGISLHAYNVFDGPVNIKALLEQELPFPVNVGSNVSSYLNSELIFNDMGSAKNIFTVKWGPGVGSASIFNGVLYKGNNYHSAELGHTMVNPKGKKCRCGKVGCLETELSLQAITDRITELADTSPEIQRLIEREGMPSVSSIASYFHLQDPDFRNFIGEAYEKLALALNNAIQLLVPDKIILFGDFFDVPDVMENFLDALHRLNDTIPVSLFEKGSLSKDYRHIGAAAIAVDAFLIDTGGEVE